MTAAKDRDHALFLIRSFRPIAKSEPKLRRPPSRNIVPEESLATPWILACAALVGRGSGDVAVLEQVEDRIVVGHELQAYV